MSKGQVSIQELEGLLPAALQWAGKQERRGLRIGLPLSPPELAIARRAGIIYPDRVRLIQEPTLPRPTNPKLRRACAQLGFKLEEMAAMALGYAIFVIRDRMVNPSLAAHELRHVAQFEMHGGVEGFLPLYLAELRVFRYEQAPFERDAREFAKLYIANRA